jgi:hypothetical protein
MLPAVFYSRKSIFDEQKPPQIQSKIKETILCNDPLSRQDRFEKLKPISLIGLLNIF